MSLQAYLSQCLCLSYFINIDVSFLEFLFLPVTHSFVNFKWQLSPGVFYFISKKDKHSGTFLTRLYSIPKYICNLYFDFHKVGQIHLSGNVFYFECVGIYLSLCLLYVHDQIFLFFFSKETSNAILFIISGRSTL